jgi:adenosine deaminase
VDTPWAITHTTTSVLRDFAADGVVYLELRTTPRAMPKAGLSKSQYVETVLAAISAFESAGPSSLRTRLILSIDRRNTLAEAMEVVALARAFRTRGVVGLDLCGDPKRGGIGVLAPAFDLARREVPELGLTLHFAEAEASGTDEELNMLLDWRPDRIGHVIHVGEKVRDRIIETGGLGLELCLSCNVHAGMITGGFEAHHFGEWWKVKECVVALSVCC